jgi:hypothetical protein
MTMSVFAVQVDTTINLWAMLLGSGILLTLARVAKNLLDFRDEIRDLRRIVGFDHPPDKRSGLVLSILQLESAVGAQGDFLSVKHGFDRRHGDRRFIGYGLDMREDDK